MGSRYLTDLASWARQAGLVVIEVAGWQTRARSSGGYDNGRPWCVMWHHTASPASWDGNKDANYIATGSPDSPIANLYISRSGTVYVCAAGATNTNGKGGPLKMSKGTVPLDQMNTHAVGIEMGNNGVGEPWPQAQIDAAFKLSNQLCAKLGLRPTDIANHSTWAPTRKIDPATAAAVQGPWKPRSINSSGSWNQDDVRNEAARRAGSTPAPIPVPPEPGPPSTAKDDEMLVVATDANGTAWVGNGIHRMKINSDAVFQRYILVHRDRFVNTSGQVVKGWQNVGQADNDTIAALGFA